MENRSEVPEHYYYLHGVGKFDNMKKVARFLNMSRSAIKRLRILGVLEMILIDGSKSHKAHSYEKRNTEN